jgi:hypothetical protein
MREIQHIEGFSFGRDREIKEIFPYFSAGEDVDGERHYQKNYSVRFCCMSTTNGLRSKLIDLVALNPWFDRVILVFILTNMVFLAVEGEI